MLTIKIYILIDPITNEVRYVGKTEKKLIYRLSGHICESIKSEKKSHRSSWIKGLLAKNTRPIIELLDEIDYTDDWGWLEIYWINQLKAWGFRLTNMSDGGEGSNYGISKRIVSKETIEKRRITLKRRIDNGEINYSSFEGNGRESYVMPETTKEKLRQINLGKKQSKETKLKRSKSFGKNGLLQLDANNNVLNEFKTLTEAVEKSKIPKGTISTAIRRKNVTREGHKWKYKNEDIVES
jgi:hypothetical protein